MMHKTLRLSWGIVLLMWYVLCTSGCWQKKYKRPELPCVTQLEQICDNGEIAVKQGFVTKEEVEASLYEEPARLTGIVLEIENKSAEPMVLEINKSNQGIYDTEDLALIFSKIALKNDPAVSELTHSSSAMQGALVGFGLLSSSVFGYSLYKALKERCHEKGIELTPQTNKFFIVLSVLSALPVLGFYSYLYRLVGAEKKNVLESEEERLIDQFRTLFTPVVLSFDDSIQIKPYDSIKQFIFFDSKPISQQAELQRELVLSYKIGDDLKFIPLPM